MLYVAAERSYVAGVSVPHFGDCVPALIEAGAEAGRTGGETGGDGSGVRAERCGKRRREEEREGEEQEMHVHLRRFDVGARSSDKGEQESQGSFDIDYKR